MTFDDFIADKENQHVKDGNPSVKCNSLSKTKTSFNCYLTAPQAIALARNLLEKSQIILDHQINDAVVHVWNVRESSETLSCGLNKARKGAKRKKSGSSVEK